MAGTYDYQQMLDLVGAYYGSGSDQWLKVAGAQGASADELLKILQQTPGVETLVTESGQYAGWRLASQESYGAVSNVGSLVNSNTAGGATSVQSSGMIQVPGQFAESAGNVAVKSGAVSTGAKTLQFVSGTVLPATIAVATGLKLGYTIDKALYDINPDIFTYNGVEFWNPDVMKDISLIYREEGLPLQEKLWNGLWGINQEDNTTQLYAEETQFAYMAGYMQQQGFFTRSIVYPSYKDGEHISVISHSDLSIAIDSIAQYSPNLFNRNRYNDILTHFNLNPDSPYTVSYTTGSRTFNGIQVYIITPAVDKVILNNPIVYNPAKHNNYLSINDYYSISKYGVNGYDYTLEVDASGNEKYSKTVGTYVAYLTPYMLIEPHPGYPSVYQVFHASNIGNITEGYISGVNSQDDAILPNLSTATDIESIKNLLKQQYPELWDSAVTNDVLQPDGSIKTFTYLPLPTPTSKSKYDTQPTGDGSEQNQKDTDVKPDSNTQIKDSTTTTIVSPPTTPNPPDTGGGDSPTVVPPIGKASSLWSIYNPTLEQVNQFGSWLWSSNFVEQLKKLFNDPMQAIIGLHKVYSPVQTTGQGTIKCGYLDSGVPCKLVSEQYVTVDCGSVDMQEYFGNVFDYPPYTEISIYLPFIGIRQLDPSDVMRSTISVKYHIDVLTGACLAEVNVQRDASGGTLYTFSGDAAVRYPVSSGSYMGIVSGLIGVATSIVSGNLLPALGGATRLHTNVDRSGSFTGNSGAMGSKVPYIIISRPQAAMANKFETLSGYPSNTYTQLSACKGFTQVKYCHVENLSATETEKNEIERMLKEGVIL